MVSRFFGFSCRRGVLLGVVEAAVVSRGRLLIWFGANSMADEYSIAIEI